MDPDDLDQRDDDPAATTTQDAPAEDRRWSADRPPPPPGGPLRRWGVRILVTALLLGSLAGLAWTVTQASTGSDEASEVLPDAVDRLIPASGSEVLRQTTVGIDVAAAHDAYLVINGTEVRTAEDGLVKDLGSGLITFTPGAGKPVEALLPQRNCVLAFVWPQLEGERNARPVSWCFDAS
jgi:hypothetical protein